MMRRFNPTEPPLSPVVIQRSYRVAHRENPKNDKTDLGGVFCVDPRRCQVSIRRGSSAFHAVRD